MNESAPFLNIVSLNGETTPDQSSGCYVDASESEKKIKNRLKKSKPLMIVTNVCLMYSKDKVSMGKSHVIHFLSVDGNLDSNVSKELIDNKILIPDSLRNEKLILEDVIVFAHNNRYIFHVIGKNKSNERSYLNIISKAILALKNAINVLKVNEIRVSNKGNNMDDVSWTTVEKLFLQHFSGTENKIIVCLGDIINPEFNKREQIIKEFHESTMGGHKGISKTDWRIRAIYYWPGMKMEIGNFITKCQNCQRNKIIRTSMRQSMRITDTPKQPFDKIQIGIVGPLPVTPQGNRYILTIQCNFSKYSDALPLKSIDSLTIAHALAEQFICRYGCPMVIHTD